MQPRIRIVLVDDHTLVREGLASLLDSQPDIQVVGEAGDGLEALVKAQELGPDLVLMDVTMPGCDGLEATRLILQAMPDVRIVMLTVHDEDEKLFEAIRSGAVDYAQKHGFGSAYSYAAKRDAGGSGDRRSDGHTHPGGVPAAASAGHNKRRGRFSWVDSPHIPQHISMGLYGLILVEPAGGLPPVETGSSM